MNHHVISGEDWAQFELDYKPAAAFLRRCSLRGELRQLRSTKQRYGTDPTPAASRKWGEGRERRLEELELINSGPTGPLIDDDLFMVWNCLPGERLPVHQDPVSHAEAYRIMFDFPRRYEEQGHYTTVWHERIDPYDVPLEVVRWEDEDE